MRIKNGLVVGVILLFVGVAVQPSVATVQPEKIDVEPKDYLFQTILDIANNPDVKELFEQNSYDLFKVDIDRSIYHKIIFRNPRLFFNTLFTNPSMSLEYLNKCYNKGIELTTILGEDKSFKILESVEVTDIEFLDELNNIVKNDEELSGRLTILKEMNKGLNPGTSFDDNPVICFILLILIGAFLLPVGILGDIRYLIGESSIIGRILFPIQIVLFIPLAISLVLFLGTFTCIDFYPYI